MSYQCKWSRNSAVAERLRDPAYRWKFRWITLVPVLESESAWNDGQCVVTTSLYCTVSQIFGKTISSRELFSTCIAILYDVILLYLFLVLIHTGVLHYIGFIEAVRAATYSMYRYSVDRFRIGDFRRRTSQYYRLYKALSRTGSYSGSVIVTWPPVILWPWPLPYTSHTYVYVLRMCV